MAGGGRERLSDFGGDRPTGDGAGVRDYLHVVDLVMGHISAVKFSHRHQGFTAINLGTGRETSVLELLRAFEHAFEHRILYTFVEGRPGDVGQSWTGVDRVRQMLGWTATRSLHDMCVDGWRWRQANPCGYRSAAAGGGQSL